MKVKCNKCGNEVQDNNFCSSCGNMLNSNSSINANNSNNSNNNINSNNSKDDINLVVGILLTICSPVIGIVFCCVMSSREPRLKKVLYFAVGYIIVAVLFVAVMIFIKLSVIDDLKYNNDDEHICSNYCSGGYVVEGNTCICKDGRTYELYTDNNDKYEDNNNDDIIDNKPNPDTGSDPKYDTNNDSKSNNDENYVITEFNKDEWLKLTKSNTYVINVIAASWCPHCQNFKPVITEVAEKTKTKLFFIEVDKLKSMVPEDAEDYIDAFTTTYELKDYNGGVPYMFVTRNGKVVAEHSGEMNLDRTMEFINNTKQYM